MSKINWIKVFVNFLTTMRLVVVLILFPFIRKMPLLNVLIIVCLLFLTDFVDGKMARKFRVQTVYGTEMDTIADKVLNVTLLFALLDNSVFIYYLLIAELIIMGVNFTAKVLHKEPRSSIYGKVKMWFVFACIFVGLLNKQHILIDILYLVTLFVQVVVIIDYLLYLFNKEEVKKRMKIKNSKDLRYYLFDTEYYFEKYGDKKRG